MKRVVNPVNGKFRYFEMSDEEYRDLADTYTGLCVACGNEQGEAEPDAQQLLCEACGKRGVYGAEDLLMMGRIKII